jgi:hypothetical protein
VNTNNGNVFHKTGAGWGSAVGNIRGPAGANGTDGASANVYDASGTLQPTTHFVRGTAAITNGATGSVTVTLAGSAVFTSNATYTCTVTGVGTVVNASNRYSVDYTSGSSFTVYNSGGNQTLAYICVGS